MSCAVLSDGEQRGQMMVRIIRAAMGYSTIPAGFPILVSERMSIIKPAFAWLLELATIPGRSHAAETVRTYAEHLHEWFDSLEQSGLDWRGVSEAEIASWRNRMLSQPSPHTKRPYARSTVNDRVRTICRFYAWAQGRGMIESLPFHFVDVRVGTGRRQSFLAHVDGRPGVMAANILTVSEHEHLPRPLRVDQLRRVFAHLEMPYGLMAEWALSTGLRRKELCGLAVFQVPETAHLDAEDHPLIGVPLTITKGDKPRTIYPPIRLVDRTQRYVDEVRTPQVRALRRRRASYQPPSALFLNGHGNAVSKARLTAVFAEAFRAAGVAGSLHCLRHTYATTMLVQLQRQAMRTPDLNPLKIVQVLLGHSSIQSTAIYLRCVELHGRDLADSIDYLYGELIPDGR
ncbi:tyrosine-type recombinase/integrase [Brucella anthropi]|uniref:tyrosine-type recombinase/integrase n=3 Tax=Pseudomonadota TaxID=1224 RepID=UPI001F48262E|nr:tyrosine-type recombinase/integrase [Brucella anthropi]